MTSVSFAITEVRSPEDIGATAALFEAYAASLEIDLAYQDFAGEIAALPGKYAPPKGELLLARGKNGQPLGCVALRSLPEDGCCEMKRMYVTPAGRGLGVGKALAQTIVADARRIGYRQMRLDTLPTLTAALALYAGMGFKPIPPYYDTPIAGTLFFRLML